MSEIKGISLDGSPHNLKWDFVETEAHKRGFKETSKFIQYLLTKELVLDNQNSFKKKYDSKKYLVDLLILCMITLTFIFIMIIFFKGGL